MGLMNVLYSMAVFIAIGTALLNLGPVAAQVDLKMCTKGIITPECGHSLGQRVAQNVSGIALDDECCAVLLDIGKPCHDAFTQEHVKKQDYVGTEAELLERSETIWTDCVDRIVSPPIEGPNPIWDGY